MKDVGKILDALKVFNGNAAILYDSINGETVTFQDVIDCVNGLQNENERLNDMKFTQEHCNLYEENEWLKDMLRQYMNGELINEDVFCNQVKDIQEAVKYTVKKIYDEIGNSDILVVETQEYGEIEVVPIERLKEIVKSKGLEVE